MLPAGVRLRTVRIRTGALPHNRLIIHGRIPAGYSTQVLDQGSFLSPGTGCALLLVLISSQDFLQRRRTRSPRTEA